MKRISTSSPMPRLVCLAIAASLSCAGIAQTMQKEGPFDITNCWAGTSSTVAFSKTDSAFSGDLTGTMRSNPAGGPFDMMTFHCVNIFAAIEGKTNGTYYCVVADKDGDKFMLHGSSEGPKGKTETFAGTGKFEGMVRTSTSEPLGAFPPVKPGAFQGCHRQTGTYKLKSQQ